MRGWTRLLASGIDADMEVLIDPGFPVCAPCSWLDDLAACLRPWRLG